MNGEFDLGTRLGSIDAHLHVQDKRLEEIMIFLRDHDKLAFDNRTDITALKVKVAATNRIINAIGGTLLVGIVAALWKLIAK